MGIQRFAVALSFIVVVGCGSDSHNTIDAGPPDTGTGPTVDAATIICTPETCETVGCANQACGTGCQCVSGAALAGTHGPTSASSAIAVSAKNGRCLIEPPSSGPFRRDPSVAESRAEAVTGL